MSSVALNEVVFDINRSSKSQKNIYLTFIEQFLACNFSDYRITITENLYNTITVKIIFQNIEDATFFKLRMDFQELRGS